MLPVELETSPVKGVQDMSTPKMFTKRFQVLPRTRTQAILLRGRTLPTLEAVGGVVVQNGTLAAKLLGEILGQATRTAPDHPTAKEKHRG